MDTPTQILEIEQLIASSVALLSSAWQAFGAGDQATLDQIHARAVKANEAFRPPGEPEVAVADVAP